MIRLSRELLDRLRRAGARAYPEEGCGVLLGHEDDDSGPAGQALRTVTGIRPVENARTSDRKRRYLIPPETFRRVEEEAREAGLEVLGFYHSHPDHPAEPSRTDKELAWPWYSYVIVPVRRRIPGTPRSWRLLNDRSRFRSEEIQVVATGAVTEPGSGAVTEPGSGAVTEAGSGTATGGEPGAATRDAPSRVHETDPTGRRPRNLKEQRSA